MGPAVQHHLVDAIAVPDLTLEGWRLRVEGCVERPGTWSWDDSEATADPAGSRRSSWTAMSPVAM